MTLATPASATRRKWGRYTSCSALSSTRTSTVKRAFSMEFRAKCFMQPITWRCRPAVRAAAISPTWWGSSP